MRVASTGLVELELLGCLFPGFSRAVAAAKNIDECYSQDFCGLKNQLMHFSLTVAERNNS